MCVYLNLQVLQFWMQHCRWLLLGKALSLISKVKQVSSELQPTCLQKTPSLSIFVQTSSIRLALSSIGRVSHTWQGFICHCRSEGSALAKQGHGGLDVVQKLQGRWPKKAPVPHLRRPRRCNSVTRVWRPWPNLLALMEVLHIQVLHAEWSWSTITCIHFADTFNSKQLAVHFVNSQLFKDNVP